MRLSLLWWANSSLTAVRPRGVENAIAKPTVGFVGEPTQFSTRKTDLSVSSTKDIWCVRDIERDGPR